MTTPYANPSSAGTLVISYVGMLTQEVEIQPNVVVSLKSDNEMLDEVVVIGYGSGKKLGSVVGSVAAVSGTKLESALSAVVRNRCSSWMVRLFL